MHRPFSSAPRTPRVSRTQLAFPSSSSELLETLALLLCGVQLAGCTSSSDAPSGIIQGEPEQSGGDAGSSPPGTTSPDAGSSAPPPEEACEDVYPFMDGFTCAEQASWGKCNETWLQGYCNASCNRCGGGPIDPAPSFAGPRNVFTEYTSKLPLAPTPPMGWNSWNRFACNIDETLIRETADAMVASGMREAGYEYINIDDCWQAPERDGSGNLVADPVRFPSGIQGVAEYVHSLDLKLGIYSDRGTSTCAGYPGSYDYEIQDAQTFAAWGVDYLKYDNCAVPLGREGGAEMQEDYAIMGEALRQSGRPIATACAPGGFTLGWSTWATCGVRRRTFETSGRMIIKAPRAC